MTHLNFPRSFMAVALLSLASSGFSEDLVSSRSTAIELFNERIMPIFRSPNPSSCVQCHLSSVELKNYILPSHEETFISLRDQGLIDLDSPAESKILKLIDMGEKDADKRARLIHAKTRQAEYEAFAAWIAACCEDSELRDRPAAADFVPARPDKPDPVIRHARKSRVVDSFVRNVWSQRMRCFPCHTPHEIDPNNPKHKKPAAKQAEMVKTYGQRMNLFRKTPEETLQQLIVSSRKSTKTHLPLLNLQDPRNSLLLLKPTSKLPKKKDDGTFPRPSSVVPVTHMGGLKMHIDDQSYKAFSAWIQDYADVVQDRYLSVKDLPADNWVATKRVIRLKDCPPRWPVGTPVQLFVHAWNKSDAGWEKEAVAFTQGTVTPRRLVNGLLTLLSSEAGTKNHDPDRSLVPGKYRISVYADLQHRIEKNPAALLGAGDLEGHVEIQARWQQGFPKAEMISFETVTVD